jgi:hypothetical protein
MKKFIQANSMLFILAASASLLPMSCIAQWSDNSHINTIISIDAETQKQSVMVTDGAGGAIIAWYDTRNDDGDIYAQRIDANGVIQWTANGISISSAASMQAQPALISDGSGGAIITWTDLRNGNDFNIYAQRVNGSGLVQWAPDGVIICDTPRDQVYPTLAADGNGGAFITWGYLDGMYNDIFVQGINANGSLKGPVTLACSNPENQVQPAIISDNDGGAIVVWKDSRNQSDGISASDIFAQRISTQGISLWTTDGVAICEAPRTQENAILIPDGSGGAIITWQDERDVSISPTNVDIYAQHINASGHVQWASGGLGIYTTSDKQFRPSITTDQAGGAFIACQIYAGLTNTISVQRVGASGTKLWMSNGVPIGSAGKEFPIIISDGDGGAFLTWEDGRSSGVDLYAQHLDANGAELWALGGVPISTAFALQTKPHLVLDSQGGAIISWDDYRNTLSDIYSQHIMVNGSLGGASVVGNQTITFNPIPEKKFSDASFTLGAIASSGLTVTYTSSNTSVATISGTALIITGVGTSTITANQPGNANFNAAPPASQQLMVTKGDQFITFHALPAKTEGDPAFTLSATASSDLAVSYASSDIAVATVSGNTITVVGLGTTNITASQAGNVNYHAAANVIQPLVVKESQHISFSSIPDKTLGDPVFTLSATSSASLPVTFSSPSDKITISGGQVSLVKAGAVPIHADQAGNATFNAAPRVTQSFCINPSKPSISVSGLDTEGPLLTSSSTSGNQWFKDGVPINGATNVTFTVTMMGAYTVVASVDNCISVPSDEIIFVITGIEKNDVAVKVYPNPMEDYLVVDVQALGSATPVSISIYDVLGHIVHAAKGSGTMSINVGQYQSGIYVLKIQSNEYVTTRKLRK